MIYILVVPKNTSCSIKLSVKIQPMERLQCGKLCPKIKHAIFIEVKYFLPLAQTGCEERGLLGA